MRYNNYHCHTHDSNIMTPDCIIKSEDLAKRAIELGHTSLFTTEHGYAGNIFKKYDVAKKYGLKFVFGIEYYYVENRLAKDNSNSHLMILAKNEEGMRDMNRILREAGKTGYYYKPRIDKELLLSLNPNNVVVTSTCVISYISKHDDYEANFIQPLHNHFKENFYLEIHDNTHPMQVDYNKKILDLHNRYKIPLIHACDSHYIYPEQDKDRTEFLNGKGMFYPEEDGFILDYPDSKTIFERYEEQGVFTKSQVESSLKNTLIIDDFEDIILKKDIKMPSIYPDLSIDEKHKKLKEILTGSWNKKKSSIRKEKKKDYVEQMRFEMDIIEKTSEVRTVDYFLFNHEAIKRGKELGGVLTRTGRGSAPSFFLNNLLGFTEVDSVDSPIPLYPTRFMSASRILETKSLPDIDFNVANPKPFIQACKEILGEDNVYPLIKFGTMQEKEAFRNLCRARGIDNDTQDRIADDFERYKSDPEWKDFIKESEKFIDVIVSASPSTSSFLLLDKPISEEVGVVLIGSDSGKDKKGKKKEKVLTCCIDSETTDDWKFLKNDILPVTVWEIISSTFEMVGRPIPNITELLEMVDDKVWNVYAEGLTATLNQVGTESGTPQIMRYKPKNIAELSAWVAAIRPGFKSMKDIFLDRQSFSYGIPDFDKLLENSGNFCLYQEDVMSTLMFVGFPEDETYGILKKISKKKREDIEKIKPKFIKGFIDKTGSESDAEKVWQILEDNADYSFNSSHSLSVALDSLYGAYLKVNHPLEYFSVILQIYEGDTETTSKIFRELSHFGVGVSSIKFRKSKAHYSPDIENRSIFKGLKSIKYLNKKISEELFELGKKEYKSFLELLIDIEEDTSVDSRQLTILIKLNFFEEFGKNGTLFTIYEKFKERYKKTHVDKTKEKRIEEIREFAADLKEESISLYDQIISEQEYLGYIQSSYPNEDKSKALVLTVNTKYSPRITLYQLSTGNEIIVKVNKKRFFREDGSQFLYEGDLIEVRKTIMKPKKKLIDGEWTDLPEKELWLEGRKVLSRINN